MIYMFSYLLYYKIANKPINRKSTVTNIDAIVAGIDKAVLPYPDETLRSSTT